MLNADTTQLLKCSIFTKASGRNNNELNGLLKDTSVNPSPNKFFHS